MTNGKVVVITGASRGIGRETALGLADDGYNVVLIARSKKHLQETVEEMNNRNRDALLSHSIYNFDVTDSQQVKQTIKKIEEKFGRIDVLINNAGVYTEGTFTISSEEFDRMLKVNLVAPFTFMQEVLPIMKRQNSGHIINISSRAGKYGFAGDGGYVASKFGLVGLNESAYREFSSCAITVTAICPGWTNTDMVAGQNAPVSRAEMIQPSDILKTIRWLLNLSPGARIREVVLECNGSIC